MTKSLQKLTQPIFNVQKRERDTSDLISSNDSHCLMKSEKSDISSLSRIPRDPLKSILYMPAHKKVKKPLKKCPPTNCYEVEREGTAHFADSERTREQKRETEATEKINLGTFDKRGGDDRFNYLKNEM